MSDVQAISPNTLSADLNTFLQLLTTQMQNQDPLSPTDPTQFVAQLAQFSSVEQAIQTNNQLSTILGQLQADSLKLDAGLIGRQAEIETSRIALNGGSASINYELPREADEASLRILNETGTVVAEIDAPTNAGSHQLIWDGTDLAGGTVVDGIYTAEIIARDAAGDPIFATTRNSGRVQEIRQSAEATLFVLDNGIAVTENDILSLREPPVTP